MMDRLGDWPPIPLSSKCSMMFEQLQGDQARLFGRQAPDRRVPR